MYEAEKKKYTVKDYEQLPEGSLYQLIDGDLIMTPAPNPYHQRISIRLSIQLNDFIVKNGLGEILVSPIDVNFSETETFQPDIIFVAKGREGIIGEQKIEGAPDLVIEILSPATAYYDLKSKKKTYEAYDVKEYWIVDPVEKNIEVYENIGKEFKLFLNVSGKDKVKSKLLAGLEISLNEIF